MIISRTSFSPMTLRTFLVQCTQRIGLAEASSGHQRSAEVEAAVTDLGLGVEPVGLVPAGPEKVDDRLAAGDQELGDQPPVTPPPEGLGAHEARKGLGQRARQGLLPGVRSHPGRITPKRCGADTREALLAGFAAAPAAELLRVPVGDTRRLEGCPERLLVELRVSPGPR